MRYQQDAEVKRYMQIREQIQYVFLDSDIQCRGRFVCHDKGGLRKDRKTDQRALQHPTRELMRIGPIDTLWIWKIDACKSLEDRRALRRDIR